MSQPLVCVTLVPATGNTAPPRTDDGPIDIGHAYLLLRRSVQAIVAAEVDAPDEQIEDACQVAWMRLLTRADDVAPAAVRSWLAHTAKRELCRQLWRRRHGVSLDAALEGEVAGAEVINFPAPISLEEQLEYRLSLEEIARLSERAGRIFWLFGAGLSYAEIAVQTGESIRSVERILANGRKRLRREAA